MRRTFPEFTKFLAHVLGADEAHVRHCIRRCREADLLPRGRPGGGSPVVTSEDAAKSFLAVLAADRPIDAPAALALIAAAVPQLSEPSEIPDVPGLVTELSKVTLASVLGAIIEARRADPGFELNMEVRVERGTIPLAWLPWGVQPNPHRPWRWREIFFCADQEAIEGMGITQEHAGADSPIHIEAKCSGLYLHKIADWLEGR